MSREPDTVWRDAAQLDGAALLIPRLQADPLTLRAAERAPCTEACPAGINVKAYVSLIAEGRFGEALQVVRRHCPLPGICGRICHHPCEAVCLRGETDAPVAIRSLKRFVADLGLETPFEAPDPLSRKFERIAVIGSGPAGLTAAHDLRLAGYPVTVFEAEPEPGGMLRYGIADYRLPPEVLDAEIDALRGSGLEILTGRRIGEDLSLEELLEGDYSAVLFAVGAQSGRPLGVTGEDECAESRMPLSFLHRVNAGERSPCPGKVLVIGGGLTAIEAARSALRLGADPVESSTGAPARRCRPARRRSRSAGRRHPLSVSPRPPTDRHSRWPARRRWSASGTASAEPDASGRRRPVPIPGSETLIPADRILGAIGQSLETGFLPAEAAARVVERGRMSTDPDTSMTPMQGVFAAGDAVSGPATVIEAVLQDTEPRERFAATSRLETPKRSPGPGRC